MKTITLILIAFAITSCGSKKNQGSSTQADQSQSNPTTDEIAPATKEKLIQSYELRAQTESFYVPQEAKSLRIVVTPILKKEAKRSSFTHFIPLLALGSWSHGQRNPSTKVGVCKIEESRVTAYTVSETKEKIAPSGLNAEVDESPISFSPNSNFKYGRDESTFSILLPKSKRDYFIELTSKNISSPVEGKFNTEECDRASAQNPNIYYDRHSPLDLSERRTDSSIWVSYKVEVYMQ